MRRRRKIKLLAAPAHACEIRDFLCKICNAQTTIKLKYVGFYPMHKSAKFRAAR